MYQVPCKEGRYTVRETEHKRDIKTLEEKYTRSRKIDSLMTLHPLAITDHVAKENHTIDWEGMKFPVRDTAWTARGMKEAVEIRKIGAHTTNRDGSTTNFYRCTLSCW